METIGGLIRTSEVNDGGMAMDLRGELMTTLPGLKTVFQYPQGMLVHGQLKAADGASQQPVWSKTTGHAVVFDGRIDNRGELIDDLEANGTGRDGSVRCCVSDGRNTPLLDGLRAASDAELLLQYYVKRQRECFSTIVGDFACAVWDPWLRAVILARDFAGTRPLFYSVLSHGYVWASTLETLMCLVDSPFAIDEQFIGSYLVVSELPGHSPYKSIRSVEPGCSVTLDRGSPKCRSFWSFDPSTEIRYRDDSEYEEQFRSLFEESLRVRLRKGRTVVSELSGGLDSSSIVCVADQVIASNESLSTCCLETVSYVYDESRSADERPFIKLVEGKRGKSSRYIRDDNILGHFEAEARIIRPNPLHWFAHTTERVREVVSEIGSPHMLSGIGGDHLMLHDKTFYPLLLDCIKRGRIGAALRHAGAWHHRYHATYWELLWKGIFLPLLPIGLRVHAQEAKLPEWLDEGFVRKTSIDRRWLVRPEAEWLKEAGRQRQYSWLLNAISHVSQNYYRECVGIDMTYPFLHKPLAEFLAKIPMTQKLRPGETRSLQRRALRGILPEPIRMRKGQLGPEEPVLNAVSKQWQRVRALTRDAMVCSCGFVNRDRFEQAALAAKYGILKMPVFWSRALTLEAWLRAHHARYSDARPLVGRMR